MAPEPYEPERGHDAQISAESSRLKRMPNTSLAGSERKRLEEHPAEGVHGHVERERLPARGAGTCRSTKTIVPATSRHHSDS